MRWALPMVMFLILGLGCGSRSEHEPAAGNCAMEIDAAYKKIDSNGGNAAPGESMIRGQAGKDFAELAKAEFEVRKLLLDAKGTLVNDCDEDGWNTAAFACVREATSYKTLGTCNRFVATHSASAKLLLSYTQVLH